MSRSIGRGLSYLVLAAVTFVLLFPLLYAISGSLMSAQELSRYPPALLPSSPRLGSFADVLKAIPLARQYLNSAVVSIAVMLGQLVTATSAAYAFGFLRFPLRNLAFAVFLATMMIPWEAVIIPNYLFMAGNGLLNTYPALILPFLATGFGTFLLRQFFLTFPRDLFEAALVDGRGHLRFLWTILVPLSRPWPRWASTRFCRPGTSTSGRCSSRRRRPCRRCRSASAVCATRRPRPPLISSWPASCWPSSRRCS